MRVLTEADGMVLASFVSDLLALGAGLETGRISALVTNRRSRAPTGLASEFLDDLKGEGGLK